VAEVIVVDDGSTDRTVEVVASHGPAFEALRVVRLHDNQGKGAAVRAGMLTASGDLRLFMDADNAAALDQLDRLLSDARLDAATSSVAVGSIAAGETDVREQQPVVRRVLGRLGNLATQAVAVPGVRDTQRGFKLFTADAAEVAFGPLRSTRWVFDVEALARARRAGHRIIEVPITWRHIDGGEIRAGSYVSSLRELGRIVARLGLERLGFSTPEEAPVDVEPVTVSPPNAGAWPEPAEEQAEVAPEPG
jgi:dolichyl-phosphate beta-glucosyltransferase